MHQDIALVTSEQRVEPPPVSNSALHERRVRRHRLPVAATQVVQHYDGVAPGEKLPYHDAADVARPAGDEDATPHPAAPGRRAASGPRAGRSRARPARPP